MESRFFRLDGCLGPIHICTEIKPLAICGTHINFPDKTVEVKFFDDELKEYWGDGKIQKFKWVKVFEYNYCQKCLKKLKKI